MIGRAVLAVLLLSAWAGSAGAQSASDASPLANSLPPAKAVSSRAFVNRAAVDDLFEIRAAELAQRRSTNDAVKAFAARLIEDHTNSTSGLLDALHQAHLVSVESIPTILDRPRQAQLSQLEGLGAADFDQRYMAVQMATDQETLSLLQGYMATGDNTVLRQYAHAVMPTVAEHLDMAQRIVSSGYKKVSDLD